MDCPEVALDVVMLDKSPEGVAELLASELEAMVIIPVVSCARLALPEASIVATAIPSSL